MMGCDHGGWAVGIWVEKKEWKFDSSSWFKERERDREEERIKNNKEKK